MLPWHPGVWKHCRGKVADTHSGYVTALRMQSQWFSWFQTCCSHWLGHHGFKFLTLMLKLGTSNLELRIRKLTKAGGKLLRINVSPKIWTPWFKCRHFYLCIFFPIRTVITGDSFWLRKEGKAKEKQMTLRKTNYSIPKNWLQILGMPFWKRRGPSLEEQ